MDSNPSDLDYIENAMQEWRLKGYYEDDAIRIEYSPNGFCAWIKDLPEHGETNNRPKVTWDWVKHSGNP